MNDKHDEWKHALVLVCSVSVLSVLSPQPAFGQAPAPALVDQNLAVRTVVAGLNQPTTMAFIGPNDIFVLEKPSGKVQRVRNGAIIDPYNKVEVQYATPLFAFNVATLLAQGRAADALTGQLDPAGNG